MFPILLGKERWKIRPFLLNRPGKGCIFDGDEPLLFESPSQMREGSTGNAPRLSSAAR
jgi:hypothetical protein